MLNEPAVQKIIRGLRKAVSLRSFILNGNPGILQHIHADKPSESLIARAGRYLQAEVKLNRTEVPPPSSDSAESVYSDDLLIKAQEVTKLQQASIETSFKKEAFLAKKPDDLGVVPHDRQKCIFSRKLGLDKFCPSTWQILCADKHECFVRENHIFTVFLWNQKVGKIQNCQNEV